MGMNTSPPARNVVQYAKVPNTIMTWSQWDRTLKSNRTGSCRAWKKNLGCVS